MVVIDIPTEVTCKPVLQKCALIEVRESNRVVEKFEMDLWRKGFHQQETPYKISSVLVKRVESMIIWVNTNEPLVAVVILRCANKVEQVKENPKQRFPRLMLCTQLEYFCVGPGLQTKL